MPAPASLTSLSQMTHAAQCLKTIAHPVRLRMIEALLDHRLNVGELAALCGTPHNVASEHLSRMRDRGLLSAEREGRQTYYTVAEPGLRSIIDCVRSRFG